MLNKLISLIEKSPKKAAVIGLLVTVPLLGIQGILDLYKPQITEQTQAKANRPLDNRSEDEIFDNAKCKVYFSGVLIGAEVFRFRNSSGDIYLMFTDSDQLIDKHQNRGINIWLPKGDFLRLIGNDLIQQMSPEVKEVLASQLDGSKYVAVVDEDLASKAQSPSKQCVR